jgi:ABC-type glycerol-3-phosphate transport system permease component
MRSIGRREQLVTQLLLTLVAMFVVVPVWIMVVLAVDGSFKQSPLEFRLWPQAFSADGLQRALANPYQNRGFGALLRNSLIVSGGATLLSIAAGASMAYAFARLRFRARSAGLFALLVGAMLPAVALMVPLYVIFTALGIRTTLLALVLVYTAFAMPFCVWNMRAAFQAVPAELDDAAAIDGAGRWRAFWAVLLPIALPSIALAALIAFLTGYSEFAMGWLFVDRADNVTLAMALATMSNPGQSTPWNLLMAFTLLMCAPVVLIFLVLQRQLARGLQFGEAA